MRRLDVPEIEDQSWCPDWVRNAMTGYLQVVIEKARPYDVALPALSGLIASTRCDEILDLASGAGGPWRSLFAKLRRDRPSLHLTLTDREPNTWAIERAASTEGIEYVREPVSALDPPRDRGRIRTMFTALHHFEPSELRSIFRAAQRDRVGFAAFEATQRSVRGVLVTVLIPLLALILMPAVRPRRFLPLLLTYLPPLLPFLIWWDGFASTLRSYSAEELRALLDGLSEPGYSWEVSEIAVRGGPVPVLQVLGRPEGPPSSPHHRAP